MATYNYNLSSPPLYLPVDISASQETTWNITSSTVGSSYFTLETTRNSDGFYGSDSPKNTSGSFTYDSGIII